MTRLLTAMHNRKRLRFSGYFWSIGNGVSLNCMYQVTIFIDMILICDSWGGMREEGSDRHPLRSEDYLRYKKKYTKKLLAKTGQFRGKHVFSQAITGLSQQLGSRSRLSDSPFLFSPDLLCSTSRIIIIIIIISA